MTYKLALTAAAAFGAGFAVANHWEDIKTIYNNFDEVKDELRAAYKKFQDRHRQRVAVGAGGEIYDADDYQLSDSEESDSTGKGTIRRRRPRNLSGSTLDGKCTFDVDDAEPSPQYRTRQNSASSGEIVPMESPRRPASPLGSWEHSSSSFSMPRTHNYAHSLPSESEAFSEPLDSDFSVLPSDEGEYGEGEAPSAGKAPSLKH